mmetsp:Transcript_448/g.849  ORF Transcript_448/g.849 Transcript_448/m.849 type:complete len:513 (+) Transcript_448:105-1643(+)|eukprot:CAMPEP_0185028588 /NCGR_PEP_ID=MMETSP1103-20130426/14391_1 /TAXON_ID=36769 /ORGANISM="Paraphysomonas bandaiensis, Strain Caron Lab Isolate" /LENGTH=512 /DNA_ID=CAMNT_0027563049 /DNA_START=45 /DNA_END=1583 /DNA_ORIENTATION=-
MQFTPQQLAGGQKFSSVTRIGNWMEEIAIEEARLKEFQNNSSGGSLNLRKQQQKIAKCTQLVPLTYSPDGHIRFGDTVILQHYTTGRTFACDPYEDICPNQRKFLVSASAEQKPTARNTFRIVRPPSNLQSIEDDPSNDLLCYGQAFFLACNESLLVSGDGFAMAPVLYLSSELKNERTSTKVSNRQAVYMTSTADANAVWRVTKPSKGKLGGTERFVAVGTPVSASERFILNHRSTNTFLTTSSKTRDLTDFGEDFEVFTSRDNAIGKLSVVEAEFRGLSTGTTLSKPDLETNELCFVTAESEDMAIDNRHFPAPPSFEELLDDLGHSVRAFGMLGVVELRKAFLDIDRGVKGAPSTGRIDIEDVKFIFAQRGIVVQDGYYDPIFKSLDVRKDGMIDYRDLLDLIRGSLPSQRQEIIENIYRDIDEEGSEKVPLDTLSRLYRCSEYPPVKSGLYSEKQMKDDYFTGVIATRVVRKQEVVTLDAFVDYFADISAAVEDDTYFEDILNSTFPK